MKDKIHIVSTASLDKELIDKLSAASITTEVHPFIRTSTIITGNTKQRIAELESYSPVIVFTSANAVRAVGELLRGKPKWKIYCISGATLNSVMQYFDKDDVAAVAENASLLVSQLIAEGEAGIVFFCGNQRLDIIPQKLAENHISIEEIVVYDTELTPVKVDEAADGIMFFSSSAVKSYLSMNQPANKSICFAIGETTAQTLKENLSNQIVIADNPGKKEMVDLVLKYYHENS